MLESYAWRLEAAVWRRKETTEPPESGKIRCKPRLVLVFDPNWYSHGSYKDEYEIYGYIEHVANKPERWLVHYFPMDARGLDATSHHQIGWRGQPLHEGEKCDPRDTPEMAYARGSGASKCCSALGGLADQNVVGSRGGTGADAEQGVEGGMSCPAPIEAEDELIEVVLEVGLPQPVIDAQAPALEV